MTTPKRWQMPRKISVVPTLQDAELAEQGVSGWCAYSVAIQRKYPELMSVDVTTFVVQVTDSHTKLRYTWLPQEDVCQWIFDWDHTSDKVRFLQTNPPPRLERWTRDAIVRLMRPKTPEQKAKNRLYNKRDREAKARRTPEQVAADEKATAMRRRKHRGTWG